jgi:hypothetical protein
MSSDSGGALRIGQVLATSYSVFARNFLLLFLLAIAASIPNLVIDFLAPPQPPPWIGAVAPGVEAAPLAPVEPAVPMLSPWLLMPLILASLALSFILSAAATYIVIADLRGTPFRLGEALASGLRALPALLGVLVLLFLMLLGFAMVVGLVWAVVVFGILGDPKSPMSAVLLPLFAVPVLIVALRLSLIVPVVVAERAGSIMSMRRSAELTKGNLWRLLGVFVISALVFFVINALVFGIAFVAFGLPAFFSPVFAVVKHAVIAAEVPFYWAVVAVIYYYLRSVAEGSAATPD